MAQSPESLADLVGSPFDFADVIDYQDGAIVSRTLIDRDAATVTVFAFDESQRLSEHSAPHDAILQVVDGTAVITVGGEEQSVPAGSAIVLPADIPHAVAAEDRFKMLLTMVR